MRKLVTMLMLVFGLGLASSQSIYYDAYRSSINDVNLQTVIADLLLSNTQKDQLFALNNRYNDYDSWNRYYGTNPDRWRTDRYSEIERILGADNYIKFKKKYYKGQNPVAFYKRNKNNEKVYKTYKKYYKKQAKKGKYKGHSHGKKKY